MKSQIPMKNLIIEKVKIKDGTISRASNMIWVTWDNGREEHWTLPDNKWGREQTEINFKEMIERFSE